DGKLTAQLTQAEPVSGFRPSATVLLDSVANVCGKNAVGILLTGMGNDGAKGLLTLKQAHGHTLIQDPDSAVVFGMAGVAQSLGAVDKVIEIDQFADYLKTLFCCETPTY
ncbi:MAG: chemotaxis protein CheB, partial [Gammaproteobacteria bacterium]|nr:chemotaxis protein CheB [Gammaproteobacteria bacterium]